MIDDSEVTTAVRGRAGVITLNRPGSINSLTIGMVRTIAAALTGWRDDPAVAVVVLVGAGDRGLCAGADLRSMRSSALSGDDSGPEFFRAEYRLNAQIAGYPKPYVAVMDGVTMGGGVGLSAHGSVRVVTERSRVAMPEVTIGLVPDVGGTWLLSRAPGELGTYLALTGRTVGAADAIALGLADHLVSTDRLPSVLERLEREPPDVVLATTATDPEAPPLLDDRAWIDACFGHDDVPAILAALEATGLPQARAAAAEMRAKSPTALAVTLMSLRRARALGSLDEALEQEFRISCACLAHPDLAEGIRALIVDKDRDPRWSPSSLDQLDAGRLSAFFSDTGHGALGLTRGS